MNILISGSTGLIGSTLVDRLAERGHSIRRLVRRPLDESPRPGSVHWQPDAREIDPASLDGVDAVIHLAGEPIADGRWSAEKKRRIRDSRVVGTEVLAGALAQLDRKPAVMVSISGINYYGNGGERWLREDDPPGEGFLSEVCVEWERAADPAREAGIRVVHPRTAMVVSAEGGALKKMLTPFKLGLGGRLGDGRQYMSWITLRDEARAIEHMIHTDSLAGPVNTAAPEPVTNADFTATLGRVLGRPTVLPVPAFAARAALGDMAEELLLASLRCSARKLTDSGFTFEHPDLETALRAVLER